MPGLRAPALGEGSTTQANRGRLASINDASTITANDRSKLALSTTHDNDRLTAFDPGQPG